MLVLHPTSRCDVCLEPYASDSSPQAPHAIPCGHIFCKVCLDTVEPANCPLCRKPFMPDRVKNLHVDRPESADENREPELLEKLVMAWDAEEQELLVLLTQIEEWLNSKDEGENTALRKAVSVLAKFQKLKTRRVDDHRMIKRLKGQIADEDYQRATQSEESKAVELSLMHQIETLQSQLSRTQGEVVQLRVQTSRPGMSELNDLRNKVGQYETELEDLRPLSSHVKQYEHELRKLRQELDYYAYPSSTMRDNPLPQPPAPVEFDFTLSATMKSGSLSSTSSALPAHVAAARGSGSDAPYTNGYTSGRDTSPNPIYAPRKSKGKEREPGPSYNLNTSSSALSSHLDTSTTPTSANPYTSYNTNPSSEEVLPGASPRRRVVPSSKSKPSHLPNPTHTMDPKLVSGARPDLPTPPTPEHRLVAFDPSLSQSQRGGRAGADPARDYADPYTFAAAYVTEYAAGYGAGYQLAEYTPGQAAVVVESGSAQGQGNGQARRRQHDAPLVENVVAYVNGHTSGYTHGPGNDDRWERRDTGLGLENALGVSLSPSDTGAAPTVRSSQLSKDGNSQTFNYDTSSMTSGDSASLVLSTSSRDEGNAYPSRRAARDSDSQSSSKTQTTGYLTDTATVSSFNTGLSRATEDSMLSRNPSSRQQQSRRNGDQRTLQSVLGLGPPPNLGPNGVGAAANGNSSSTSGRANRHNSMPVQSMFTSVIGPTTATATAPQPQPTSAPAAITGDDQSVRTSLSASSWGTINTHSAPLLPWQSTGSSLNLPLRSFAPGAGLPFSGQGAGFETDLAGVVQGLEDFGPFVPEGMVVHHTGSGENTGRRGARANIGNGDDSGNGAFPVRESDEERTPMSRSTRTLASVSSVGATNGSGVTYMMDMLSAQTSSQPQAQVSSGNRDRERERDSDRDRERPRDRDRARSRDRRRQSHPASLVPTDTGEGIRHAQMMSDSEYNPSRQQRTRQNTPGATHTNAQQTNQLWFMNPAAVPTSSYTQPIMSQSVSASRPQTQAQSQQQPQGQSQSRRPHRRVSVSTVPAPINTQHTGSQSQSIVPNTAPIHASATWSEAGYYTDGPNSAAHHNNHNNHNSNHSNGGALTSPTLFNSDSSTNALGLDGLSDPRPLQITAPTPIVSSRSFLRSFSYDNF